MSDIAEKIKHLRQILPKYEIARVDTRHLIDIKYHKIVTNYRMNLITIRDNRMRTIKFIHDNHDYFEEMLLSNGFLNTTSDTFKRGNVYITIELLVIFVDNDVDGIYECFDNIETMYDDLRKIIGAKIQYKHVMD